MNYSLHLGMVLSDEFRAIKIDFDDLPMLPYMYTVDCHQLKFNVTHNWDSDIIGLYYCYMTIYYTRRM